MQGQWVSELSSCGVVIDNGNSSNGTDNQKLSKGGRPQGKTLALKKISEEKLVEAKNETAKQYVSVMKKTKRRGA